MKLTRTKGTKEAFFYRKTELGMLSFKTPAVNQTAEVLSDELLNRSMVGKILKGSEYSKTGIKPIAPDNPFELFIISLVCGDGNDNDSIQYCRNKINEIYKMNRIDAELVKKYLSSKWLEHDKDGVFEMNLIFVMNCSGSYKNIDKLKEYIKKYKLKQKGNLQKSIENNKLPFLYENGKIKCSENIKWLIELMGENGINESFFDDFWRKYDYDELHKNLLEVINKHGQKPDFHALNVDINKTVAQHNFEKIKIITKDTDEYNLIRYIRDFFKTRFPCNKDNKKVIHTNIKKYYPTIKPDYFKQQIRMGVINKLVSVLITYGKIITYADENSEIDSDLLSGIQIEEAFKKQLFISLAWGITRLSYFCNHASENIEDIDGNKTLNDIAMAGVFKIAKPKINKADLIQRLSLSFNISDTELNDSESNSLLVACWLSVSTIRNNIFHYKKDGLFGILKSFDELKPKNITFDKDLINSLIKHDVELIQESFKEQIRGYGFTEYYDFELLKELFLTHDLKFRLYSMPMSMTPSFKNVFTRGCNLSKETLSDQEYSNAFKWFKQLKPSGLDAADVGPLVYKNFIQFIYYHSFLPKVAKTNGETLVPFVKKVVKFNEKQHGKAAGEPRYAQMPEYGKATDFQAYFEHLQHLQSIRANEGETVEKHGNSYVDFVRDIYIFAFGEYLSETFGDKYKNIISPNMRIKEVDITPEESLNRLFEGEKPILKMACTFENESELNELIYIYPFLRTLDSRELNLLQHQIIRYRQSIKALQSQGKSFECLDTEPLEELIELISFTMPEVFSNDYEKVAAKGDGEKSKSLFEQQFKPFFKNISVEDYGELYFKSDGRTAENHRKIWELRRSGALALYSKIFEEIYQISQDDYEKFKRYSQAADGEKPIREIKKELARIHEKLVELSKSYEKIPPKKTDDKKRLIHEIEPKVKAYSELLKKSNAHDQLKNKLLFENLYRIHQLHVDILSRFAAFAVDWERDMRFLLTAINEVGNYDIEVERIFTKGNVVSKLRKELLNEKNIKLRKTFEQLYSIENFLSQKKEKENESAFEIRNNCAHLNHMTRLKAGTDTVQPSIITMINKLRTLLAYDKKRQNAVSKSIIDLLSKQYKVKLSFEVKKIDKSKSSEHKELEFIINNVESEKIKHLSFLGKLKTPAKMNFGIIEEDANSAEMVKLVRRLIVFESGANAK